MDRSGLEWWVLIASWDRAKGQRGFIHLVPVIRVPILERGLSLWPKYQLKVQPPNCTTRSKKEWGFNTCIWGTYTLASTYRNNEFTSGTVQTQHGIENKNKDDHYNPVHQTFRTSVPLPSVMNNRLLSWDDTSTFHSFLCPRVCQKALSILPLVSTIRM